MENYKNKNNISENLDEKIDDKEISNNSQHTDTIQKKERQNFKERDRKSEHYFLEKKNKKELAIGKILLISVIVSILAGGFSGGLVFLYGHRIFSWLPNKFSKINTLDNRNKNVQVNSNEKIVVKEESAIIDVIKKSSPAVVSIVITKDVPRYRNFFYDPFFDDFFSPFYGNKQNDKNKENQTEKQKVGGGSGFIISSDGLIVTNKHVVEDPDADYTVILNNNKEYKASVLARHPYLDVAILKIKGKNFPVLKLGDSDKLEVGQTAIAIGNSLGEFANSASVGIVSGLKRNIVAGSGFGQTEKLNNIIQTDAAINPGNSGGPLLNIAGEVIGINVAMAQGAENVGFALPINSVKKTIQQVTKEGKISIPFLGVRYVVVNDEIQKENGLPNNYGALILRGKRIGDLAVVPGSPADKAGLVENDIILEINGQKVTEKNTLSDIINRYNVGDEITLKVWHKGKEKLVKVKLEARK